MRLLLFMLLCCPLPLLAMPEPAFNQIRQQMLSAAHQDYPNAVALVEQTLQRHASTLNLDQRIRLLYHKAIFQQRTNLLTDALQTLAECKTLSLQSSNPTILYSYHNILAGIFSNSGLYQQALTHYQLALPLAQQLPTIEFVRQTENNLALVLLTLGQFSEAERYFQQFLHYGEQAQRPSISAVALTNLGDLALKRGQPEQAERFHQQALALRLLHKMESSWSWCALTAVAIYQQRWPAAQILSGQCVAQKQGRQDYEQLDAQVQQAAILQGLGQDRAAQQLLQQLLPRSQRAGLLAQQATIWQQLASIYQRLQKSAQALVAIRQYQQVREQQLQQQFSLTLAQHAATLALQAREGEISRLQQQQQLQQQQSDNERRWWQAGSTAGLVVVLLVLVFSGQIRRKNRALADSLQQLEQTRHQLVQSGKQAALGQLVCGMAHQLNTPLGTVLTAESCASEQLAQLSQSYADKKLSGSVFSEYLQNQQQLLTLIRSSSQRAASMVERFKLLSSNAQRSEPQPLAIGSYCHFYLQELLSLQGLSASQIQRSGPDPTLALDPRLLQLILQVLAENSLSHSQRAPADLQLSLTFQLHANQLQLRFCDNGQALDDTLAAKIFDPFFTTHSGHQHLGLGLTIAFNAAQQAGGFLQYDASQQHGCCFILQLPLAVEPAGKSTLKT